MAAAVAGLPWRWLQGFGGAVGLLAGSAVRVRRAEVEASMVRAGYDDAARTAAGMYRSLGIGVFELLWVLGRPRRALGAVATLGPELSALLRGRGGASRGLVLATAHTGNWDLAACALARAGMPMTIVTKRLKLGWLDAFWQGARAGEGIELIDGTGSFSRCIAAVRRGRMVALIIDQAPERSSAVTLAPFLGRVARCDLTPALVAARTGATLALVLPHRTIDGTHRIDLRLALQPPPRAGMAWAEWATTALQAGLEAFVREHPEQWLWLHRRWKGPRGAPYAASQLVSAQGQS